MNYVILGASAAGINCAQTLRNLEPHANITVISQDMQVHSRCMLHHFISGKKDSASLNFAGEDFFVRNNITWIQGRTADQLNCTAKYVVLDDGTGMQYDRLLIATGASSFVPPVKNLRAAAGVFGLRNLEDAEGIRKALPGLKRAVVLGAGLVGVDAVAGLLEQGIHIDLVELADRILPLQLDNAAAKTYEDRFRAAGVVIHTGVRAEEVLTDDANRTTGLKLSDGTVLECQMIIVATGVRPNVSFIAEGTVQVDKGILINDRCETNIPDVYAAGDVCAVTPIWPIAVKQGITAAYNMAGTVRTAEDTFGLRNTLNFMGVKSVSLGMIEAPDDAYRVHVRKDADSYRKIIEKDGVITGAILQGDIAYCGTLTHLIRQGINIAGIEKDIFEIDYADFYKVEQDGSYGFAI